jgi:hypothetical protein
MNVSASQLYAALYNTTQEQGRSPISASKVTSAGTTNRSSSLVAASASTTQTASNSTIVSLSRRALNALTNNTETTSHKSYFPVRNGYSATTLVKAIANPGATSSSHGKNIADVAKDARSRLDARYKEMEKSGQPLDIKANGKTDAYTLMGDLDRRSLFAVSSNTGSLFSTNEQAIAKSIMHRQQILASGINPDAGQSQMTLSDTADNLKAGLSFLSKVSPEEKNSADWKSQIQQLAKLSTIASKASNYAGNQGPSLFNYF